MDGGTVTQRGVVPVTPPRRVTISGGCAWLVLAVVVSLMLAVLVFIGRWKRCIFCPAVRFKRRG